MCICSWFLSLKNILNSIYQQDIKVVSVIITSDKCYDNLELERGYREDDVLGGKDVYSGSKGAAELIFKSYNLTVQDAFCSKA